jgi:hypothetical protein
MDFRHRLQGSGHVRVGRVPIKVDGHRKLAGADLEDAWRNGRKESRKNGKLFFNYIFIFVKLYFYRII